MRYFNTYGPIDPQKHYFVPRSSLLNELRAQIEEGHCFTIFAPRQMGKTTLLRQLRDTLAEDEAYLPVLLDFEGFEDLPVVDFLQAFHWDFGQRLLPMVQEKSPPKHDALEKLVDGESPTSFFRLRRFFEACHRLLPDHQIVIIIDEFDSIPQAAISDLLQTWRAIYLNSDPPRSVHSVVLIGIQNIAALNLGRSSPFNIARQMRLPDFSHAQVADLLAQYTTETGQPFAAEAVDEIYGQTAGQPFLVNRLAAITTEEVATNRAALVTRSQVQRARDQLVRESNYNFETLQRHAAEYQDEVLRILFGAIYPFTRNSPVVKTLEMYGVISETAAGNCQVANPIYERVLIDHFTPFEIGLSADILVNGHDFRPYAAEGALQMLTILSHFRHFVERRGREAFKVTEMPQEATGQYLLSAYLDILMRQVGSETFVEVPSGPGRLDLIVVYQGRRYIVETKIWRGKAEFDKGVQQLATYLETEGEPEGYFVVFHARPKVYGKLPGAELEFALTVGSKTIHVYLVRIGEFVE
ncbi:MAG: AAA-like domain-containing protein [Caldilineaceae bacterium]